MTPHGCAEPPAEMKKCRNPGAKVDDRNENKDGWVGNDGRLWAVSTSSSGAVIGDPTIDEGFPDVWVKWREMIVFRVDLTQFHSFAVKDATGAIVVGPKEGGQVP